MTVLDKVLPERHEQRVFAFVIIIYSSILIVCVICIGFAVFSKQTENVEALTGLVALTTTLMGSFATLLAARGVINHKEK